MEIAKKFKNIDVVKGDDKKQLGLVSAISVGIGLVVATSVLVSLAQGVGIAGKGFVIAMVIACILNMLTAFSFSELNSLMPVTGGLAQYTLPAFGPLVGMVAVLGGYVICTFFAGSSEAAMIGIVFTSTFMPSVNPSIVSIVFVLILMIANLFEVKNYARIQIVTTSAMIISMMLFGIIGAMGIGTGEMVVQETVAFNPMGMGVLSLVSLAFWLFVGIEYVTPLSKELKDPDKTVPLGMILGLIIVLVVQVAMVYGIYKYVPMGALLDSSLPHMLYASSLLGKVGTYWMAAISIFAVVSTLNTILGSVSRMIYGMAKDGMLPKIFTKTNKYDIPYVAVVLIGVVFIITLSTGISTAEQLVLYILTGAVFWMVAYIVAHLDVLVLRKKYPNHKRGFQIKLFGLPQIIGILGMIYMIVNVSPDPEMKVQILKSVGVWFVILTVYGVIWIKKVMKKNLFETVSIEEVLEMDKSN
ncbi:APC family permease [Clostridium grantii]|uniref:Amino acid permease n=1 Tax=Clostridium grantii DSM 8605 TaxID=1121316 RepID=A0A1M5VCA4_9CLOT|nr:APC family permease [Clostridium grantii]SHH72788.1 Amino acid permease [Clostridium grantii DSM 8605]